MDPEKLPLGTVRLRREVFDQAQSSKGGFTRAQLELLGVSFPPAKGWKRSLIGKIELRETVEKFVALKDKHLQG